MTKINIVLEGRNKNDGIWIKNNLLCIAGDDATKDTISSYTVIDETNKDQYSFWKGALGVALLGGFGAIAGVKGKNKKEYLIAIEWKIYPKHSEGNKSLILLDDRYYKVFVASMF